MLRTIENTFCLLMIYSFGGWVWESVFCSLWDHHKLINRGFLNGPYCPIYGWGALLDLFVLGKIENPVLLFFASGVLCCALEYVTSYVMEKWFHARWWDYSDMKFQFQGRICLLGFLAFGGFSVAVIDGINPLLQAGLDRLPDPAMHWISGTVFAGFAADNVITFIGISGFNRRLKEFAQLLETVPARLGTATDTVKEKIRLEQRLDTAKQAYESFLQKVTRQQKRILHAFPKLRSLPYENALNELRRRLTRRKDGTDE